MPLSVNKLIIGLVAELYCVNGGQADILHWKKLNSVYVKCYGNRHTLCSSEVLKRPLKIWRDYYFSPRIISSIYNTFT